MTTSDDELNTLMRRVFPEQDVPEDVAERILSAMVEGSPDVELEDPSAHVPSVLRSFTWTQVRELLEELIASVAILAVVVGVAAPVFAAPLRLIFIGSACVLVSFIGSYASTRERLADSEGHSYLADETRERVAAGVVNDEAAAAYLRGDFRMAANRWARRASYDVDSAYALATIYAVTSSRQHHQRSLELFEHLTHEPGFAIRASLAVALLELELVRDLARFDASIASVVSVPRDSTGTAEERALRFACAISATRDSDQRASALITRRAATLWPLIEARVRDKSGASQNDLAALVAQALAPCLPLSLGAGPAVHVLVPHGIGLPTHGGRVLQVLTRAAHLASHDVPVLRADTDPDEWRVSPGYRLAAWVARKGLGGLRLSVATFGLSCVVAALLALDMTQIAGGVMALVLFADAIDGQVVQMSSRYLARNLYLDYLMDRIADIAIGIGLYLYLVAEPRGHSGALAMGWAVATVFVSYVRAEADRFGLDASGGVVERATRNGIVAVACLVNRPLYGFFTAVALTSVTVMQRTIRAIRDAEEVEPLDESRLRVSRFVIRGGQDDGSPHPSTGTGTRSGA